MNGTNSIDTNTLCEWRRYNLLTSRLQLKSQIEDPFFQSHELASILLEVVWVGHGFSSLRLNDVYCHFSCQVWHKNFQPIAYFAGFVQKYENELF